MPAAQPPSPKPAAPAAAAGRRAVGPRDIPLALPGQQRAGAPGAGKQPARAGRGRGRPRGRVLASDDDEGESGDSDFAADSAGGNAESSGASVVSSDSEPPPKAPKASARPLCSRARSTQHMAGQAVTMQGRPARATATPARARSAGKATPRAAAEGGAARGAGASERQAAASTPAPAPAAALASLGARPEQGLFHDPWVHRRLHVRGGPDHPAHPVCPAAGQAPPRPRSGRSGTRRARPSASPSRCPTTSWTPSGGALRATRGLRHAAPPLHGRPCELRGRAPDKRAPQAPGVRPQHALHPARLVQGGQGQRGPAAVVRPRLCSARSGRHPAAPPRTAAGHARRPPAPRRMSGSHPPRTACRWEFKARHWDALLLFKMVRRAAACPGAGFASGGRAHATGRGVFAGQVLRDL